MITNLRVEHFKSLGLVDIPLSALTVFAGKNSAGKSNLIDALLFLRDCIRDNIDHAVSERHSIDSVLQWSRFKPFHLEFQVTIQRASGSCEYSIKLTSRNKEPVLLSESCTFFFSEEKSRASFIREQNRFRMIGFSTDAKLSEREIARYFLEDDQLLLPKLPLLPIKERKYIREFIRVLEDVERYSIFPNTIRYPQRPSKDTRLVSSGDNITSILKNMSASRASPVRSRYQELVSLMGQVIPNLDRILVRSISGLLWPVFEVTEEGGGTHQLNVSQVSDGALRVLGILTALYQPNPPALIAIEEPEQNVHPGVLSMLAESFKDVAQRSQLILTTHSPHLLDHFDIEAVKSVELKRGLTVVGPVSRNQRQAIKEGLLSPGEMMTMQGLELEEQ